jgi:hypothetical protein
MSYSEVVDEKGRSVSVTSLPTTLFRESRFEEEVYTGYRLQLIGELQAYKVSSER